MKLHIDKIYNQYLIGLAVNFLFAALLYSCHPSFNNLQIPVGKYHHNIWQMSDVMDYVGPAMNYLHYGVFGIKNQPDHLRAIGYPAIISFFCWLFGSNWLLAFQIFQCILFAFIYPINTLLARQLIPDISNRTISAIFIFSLVTGTYFVRPMVVLTDTFFVLLFNLGLYFGLKTFKEKSKSFLLAYLVTITLAGLIRPMLILFPLVNLIIGLFVIYRENLKFYAISRKLVITTLVFCITCNLATIRNYINYSFLSPGSFAWGIYLKQTTCKILMGANQPAQYQAYLRQVEAIPDISKKSDVAKGIMLKTIRQYPLMTLKVLWTNAINVCLDNHVVNSVANYFDYNWKVYPIVGTRYSPENPFSENSPYPFKRSLFCYYATYAFMLIYFICWLAFATYFMNLLVKRSYASVVLLSALAFILIVPGIFNGNSGSRYRLPFESFLLIFSFYQFSKVTVMNSAGYYMRAVVARLRHWTTPEVFGFLRPRGKLKAAQ